MPDDEMWESCRTDVTETNEPSADGQNDISGITGKEEQDEAQPG